MKKIVIVDYGMGNIDSVARAIEECGGTAIVSAESQDFATCHGIILPGVGSFAAGIANLRKRNLPAILDEQVLGNKIPILGICLGMQLMAAFGFEGGESQGLGWFDAEVKRMMPQPASLKIPHVGWNEVFLLKEHPLRVNIDQGRDFYFVHSYAMQCRVSSDVLATVKYGGDVTAAVSKDNMIGVQFHPEKSLDLGLQLIRNFIGMC